MAKEIITSCIYGRKPTPEERKNGTNALFYRTVPMADVFQGTTETGAAVFRSWFKDSDGLRWDYICVNYSPANKI